VLNAVDMMEKIYCSYPDYGKAPPEYLLSITEYLSYLSPEDQAALANPKNGVATVCRFLPTKAEMVEFLKEHNKPGYNPRSSTYPYFDKADDPPQPPAEARKAQVLRELGYDPELPRRPPVLPLDPKVLEAIENGTWSSDNLKTSARPVSKELKKLIEIQASGETWPKF